MKLDQYPAKIATAQRKLLDQRDRRSKLHDALDQLSREIEAEIAFDPELKNDSQRKSARIELQSEAPYQAALKKIKRADRAIALTEIALSRLENDFAVAKITARDAIARIEAKQ